MGDQESPISSPAAPRSSPLTSPTSSAASSPNIDLTSSPDAVLSPNLNEECNPEPKRRKYLFNEKVASPTNRYWPQRTTQPKGHHCRELEFNERELANIEQDTSHSHSDAALVIPENLLHGHELQPATDFEDASRELCSVDESCVPTTSDEQVLDNVSCNDLPAEALVLSFSDTSSSSDEEVSSCSDDDIHISCSDNSETEESSTEESECENSESDESSERSENLSDHDSDSSQSCPKVYNGSDVTVEEGVLVVMELFLKHKLTKQATGGFLKGVLQFLPKNNCMPKTAQALFNYVQGLSPVTEETLHFYCCECLFYIGAMERNCPLCQGKSHKFYQISLADQIKNMFENHSLADIIVSYASQRMLSPQDCFSDLLDGSEFKRAKVDGVFNLTLMGHTDGISVSESSDVSLWPLEYVISELPPHLRYKYVLVCGIWVDRCKPYMNTFLKPFVEEIQSLQEKGVCWMHPTTREETTTYVTVPAYCVDAPVRAGVQNILCPGGKNCCNLCEQKMKKLPAAPLVLGQKRRPRRRVFYFEEGHVTLRTADRMGAQGKETQRRLREEGGKLKPVKGVRGGSVIEKLPGCDRSTVVFPEYMHLLLCLIKEFMTLWFLKDGPWSLKDKRDQINSFLTSVRVPDFITRIPRSTEYFTKWKANELRSFLLYFSVIILSQCMKPEYFQHWILLVAAMYILLQDSIPTSDVTKADLLLRLFCRDFPRLYKMDFYTYYVHNLTHLALVVQRHGPLHANSTFAFENFNGILAKLIHGTKHQGKELLNTVKLAFGVEVLRARNLVPSQQALQLKHCEFRNLVKGQSVLTEDERLLLHSVNINFEKSSLYYRAVISREVYTSSIYTRQNKQNNFTICFKNNFQQKEYGEIKCFCQSAVDINLKVAVVEKFDIDHLKTFSHTESGMILTHIVPIRKANVSKIVEIHDVLHKVIRVEDFVCLRPNRHEVNL